MIRSTMGQKRYNSLAILNSHTTEVDQLSLMEVAERFVSNQDRLRDDFGTFSDEDLIIVISLIILVYFISIL